MSQYELGKTITVLEKPYLVVRLIEKSSTLFEDPKGDCFIITESYAQLRGPDGEVEFVVFYEQQQPCEKPAGQIPGLEPVIWRKSVNPQMRGGTNAESTETPRTEGDR